MENNKKSIEARARKIYPSNLYGLFVCAAIKGDLEIIKECLKRNIDISYDNHVAIRLASQKGFLDVVECLVQHGGDINEALNHGTNEIKTWANQYCCSTSSNVYKFKK